MKGPREYESQGPFGLTDTGDALGRQLLDPGPSAASPSGCAILVALRLRLRRSDPRLRAVPLPSSSGFPSASVGVREVLRPPRGGPQEVCEPFFDSTAECTDRHSLSTDRGRYPPRFHRRRS